MKIIVLDRDGWPIERIRGRWLSYLIRCVRWGRRLACGECWARRERERCRTRLAYCEESTPGVAAPDWIRHEIVRMQADIRARVTDTIRELAKHPPAEDKPC